ncbi:hypothetical protein R6Q57_001970 [Mikania cordata]
MASSQSAQISVGVGTSTSTEPTVVRIKSTTRNKDLFQHFDLCEMSNGVDKTWCKGCGTFLKPEPNSTLRSHLTKHCLVVGSWRDWSTEPLGEPTNLYPLEPNLQLGGIKYRWPNLISDEP